VLRPLPLPVIERLARRAQVEEVPAGATVFEQDDTGDAYYVIADGRVEVVQDGRLLRTLGAGDGFGEIALLRSCARTAGVRALEPTRVHRVLRADFLAAVTGHRQAAAEADATVERLLAGAP
jgi:CRP-like cAMP-binding protein